jgi:DNA-binding winged helix-turn-helix (wHTH) protein/Tfp pilus assembly protein PilF/TolB-like protein
MADHSQGRKFVFSALVFDAESGELTRNGARLRVPDQAARILAILLDRAGELVTREDLRHSLWRTGEFLDYDHSINNSISQLRDVLRDDSRTPRFIETIPKRGYRFLAEVKITPNPADNSSQGAERDEESKTGRSSQLLQARVRLEDFEIRRQHTPWRSKWLLAGAGALAVVLTVIVLLAGNKTSSTHREDIYIGIAPFEASGQDAEQLAESFRLDLTDSVSQLPAVQVRAAHSFPKGRRDDADIPALAHNLQIDTLVFGKFIVQGDDCLLQFELVRGRDAIHLASLQYRGTKAELAAIRDKAQRDIFTRLALAPSTERPVRGDSRGNTENPLAYEAYLRARYHLSQWTDDSVAKSLLDFKSAIDEDPAFAKAYSGMASAHFVLAEHEAAPKQESYRMAKDLAAKAIALDPSVAEAHAMLGQIALNQDWNFALAEKELRQAVELDPNQAVYHLWFSVLLCVQNRFDESLHQIDLAHAADSFWPPVYMTEIFLAGAAREYPRSIDSGKKLITLMPDWSLGYDQLGLTLWYAGRYQEAIDSWHKMAMLEKDTARMNLEGRGLEAFRRGGVPAYARVRLEAAKSGTHWAHAENDFDLAEWCAYAGLREEALKALEAKVARRDPGALQIALNPPFDDLHQDPRFLALLTRVDLTLPRAYPKALLSASLK